MTEDEIVELYWAAVHKQVVADDVTVEWPHIPNFGLKMEVPRATLIDGYPAPPCPLLEDCPIENHRMTLVDPDQYEELMNGGKMDGDLFGRLFG